MLFKLIICIVILLAGAGVGQLKAKTYDNRVYHLQELITTLQILESEMKYRLDPLPDLLMRVSEVKKGMSSDLFKTAARLLKEPAAMDLSICWEKAVEIAYCDSALTKEDKRIASALGFELGKTDIGNQYSLFHRTCTLLEVQVTEAIEEKKTKGKMYKSLGTAIGALIVILFI
ncbi:MAG: stage III sporulation protein AB [Eubacteriales bacterium]|nr:stage III sporulation protein AB [Eubacteriales bacterium]